MDKQFDELSKSLAEGVSRREALRKFAVGLAGVVIACLGIGGGRSASAQGNFTCCQYTCFCEGRHKTVINPTVCEPPGIACPDPGQFCFINYGCGGGGILDGASPVADCKHCK